MKNELDVKEWVRFADMDVLSAKYLNEIQYPRPLEIICYHCQQASEKMLKALMISFDCAVQKTHDLGLLLDILSDYVIFPEKVINAAEKLTPYGVKIRYPQDFNIEEQHVKNALHCMNVIYDFVSDELKKQDEHGER